MHMRTSEQCSYTCEQWFANAFSLFTFLSFIGGIESKYPASHRCINAPPSWKGVTNQAGGITDQTNRSIPRPQNGLPLFCAQWVATIRPRTRLTVLLCSHAVRRNTPPSLVWSSRRRMRPLSTGCAHAGRRNTLPSLVRSSRT